MINKQPSFGFIFDLDGVIVDTSGYHFEAWKKLASKFGLYDNQVLSGPKVKKVESVINYTNIADTANYQSTEFHLDF